MLNFFRQRKKRRDRSSSDTSVPRDPPAKVITPASSRSANKLPYAPQRETAVGMPSRGSPEGSGRDDKVANLSEQIGAHLAQLFDRQTTDQATQFADQLNESLAAIDNRADALGEKIAEDLVRQLDQQGRSLHELLERLLNPLADHITAAARKDAEEHWSAIRMELTEACSIETQRATQRPIIDRLIALLDRIRDEGAFLTTWYRKDPNFPLHIGCRQLQERYDDALNSYVAEIHMVLRGLGVEQIEGCSGPFNPHHQQVVDVEMTTRPNLDGHVAKIVRAGFMWNGAILRPEQVVVFKKERKSDEEQT